MEKKILRKCPCGCGKNEYDLGMYRCFSLTQKPFYDGWAIYGKILEPDDIDKLMMQGNTFTDSFFLDTETSSHFTIEQCKESVIRDIDNHWKRKQELIDNFKKGKYHVSI